MYHVYLGGTELQTDRQSVRKADDLITFKNKMEIFALSNFCVFLDIALFYISRSESYLPINAWFWGYYALIVLLWEA